MKNWSDGYFTDVNYTYGYYKQLNPSELRLAALAGGFAPVHNEEFNYLELGFGQGVSVSVHAAATGGTYWGTDFNPVHAANAGELTAASGAQAQLSDDSFLEFAARTDLPDFDYIALHGIWSWISDENRDVIVDLIRRKLKTGGIAYVSYNTYPGWAPFIPIRQLMSLFKDNAGAFTGAEGSIVGAVQFAKNVLAAGADYYTDIPALTRHLESLTNQGPNYIAHEYLNAEWKISTFADVARHLSKAKLSYAGPTRLLDNIESFRFPPDAQKLLEQIGDPVLKETTKDFLTNQIFRCDVYVKGLRRIPQGEFIRRWSEQLFVLTTHKGELPREVVLPFGKIKLHELMPANVIDVMVEQDYAPTTIAQLRTHPRLAHASAEDVIETMMLLVGAGHASTAQVPTPEIVERCGKLNRYVRERALVAREVECLASPITGGAVNVPHLCLLFLNALDEGRTTTQELANHVWERFQAFGKRIKQNGAPIESREESLATLEPMAQRFLDSMLPMLKTLKVI
jgi:SAM-dependent methyltransferase